MGNKIFVVGVLLAVVLWGVAALVFFRNPPVPAPTGQVAMQSDAAAPSGAAVVIPPPPTNEIAVVAPPDFKEAASIRTTMLKDLSTFPPLPAGASGPAPTIVAAGRFEPSGLVCPAGIQVTWPLASPRKPGEVLFISYFDEKTKKWRDAGGTAIVNAAGTHAIGTVYHFTDYALGDAPPPPGSDGTFSIAYPDKRFYDTAHFRIEYQRIAGILAEAKQDLTEPQWIRDMAREYERIRDLYRRVGYRVPEHQVVTLAQITHGRDWLFGARNEPDYRKEVYGEAAKTGYLTVGCMETNGKLSTLDSLKQTMAHEYFHRVQMQYYYLVAPNKFLREGTANIMELLLYPELADATVRRSDNMSPVKYDTVTLNDQGDEAASFFLYLHDTIGPHVIRRIWEQFNENRLDTSGWKSLEAAIKSFDATDSVSFRYLDFAEELLVTTPPKNPLYAIFRVGRAGVPATVIEMRHFETAAEEALSFAPLKWTFKYYIYDRPGSARGKLKLDTSTAATVRVYAINGASVSPLGTLSAGSEVDVEASRQRKIGLLVVNNRDRDGEAKVSVKWEEEKPTMRMEVRVDAKAGTDPDTENKIHDGSKLTHDQRTVRINVLAIDPKSGSWRAKPGEPVYTIRGSGGMRDRWYVPWDRFNGREGFHAVIPLKRGLSPIKLELLDASGNVVSTSDFTIDTQLPSQPDDTATKSLAEAESLLKAGLALDSAETAVSAAISAYLRQWEDGKAQGVVKAWMERLKSNRNFQRQRYRLAELTGDLPMMEEVMKQVETLDPANGFLPGELRELARQKIVFANDVSGARALWKRANAIPCPFPTEECGFLPE